ncbi:hypothetical protein [Streptoalloteichus tenebrarius]|uniref:hypothetical protein n=1 Tax=Streptoalloteichus tenebrarius (strain ATCC 17920 / DSM 40477 / JCM 4838 / CBS 697.72 / NBRC 16177 / NCIMB 11028 / NRRL B-12390 / A12253. 1 / ISP 5477) TaxID=1933 RepID=UPI0020A33433|nr:hypothetical protein [Streptoalloteichus tenebrarius]
MSAIEEVAAAVRAIADRLPEQEIAIAVDALQDCHTVFAAVMEGSWAEEPALVSTWLASALHQLAEVTQLLAELRARLNHLADNLAAPPHRQPWRPHHHQPQRPHPRQQRSAPSPWTASGDNETVPHCPFAGMSMAPPTAATSTPTASTTRSDQARRRTGWTRTSPGTWWRPVSCRPT